MAKTYPSRDAIARLAESRMKNSAISSRLGIPLRTVQKIVKQWKVEGHVQTKPRSGRKRTVNTRQMRGIIKKRIDRKDDLSLNKMAKQLNISRKSVQMIVKNELGLRSYRLLNGQVPTDQAKQNRKEKCKKLREFFKVRQIEDVPGLMKKFPPLKWLKILRITANFLAQLSRTIASEKLPQEVCFLKA